MTRSSPGANCGMSHQMIGMFDPGGAPASSPVGSYWQTPVPPEIEIDVGGFWNASGSRSSAPTCTVSGP